MQCGREWRRTRSVSDTLTVVTRESRPQSAHSLRAPSSACLAAMQRALPAEAVALMRSMLLAMFVAMTAVAVAAHDPHPLSLIASERTRLAPLAGATITLHAAGPLKGGGQNVQVSWSGMPASEGGHWIGIFSPPPEDYSKALPTKYHQIDAKLSEGHRTVWLLNQRAPTVAVFFRGGLTSPVVVAVSNHVEFESYAEPTQLHLALTRDPAEMRVSWTSNSTNSPVVRWGLMGDKFSGEANANTSTYAAHQMCGTPATGIAFRVVTLAPSSATTRTQRGWAEAELRVTGPVQPGHALAHARTLLRAASFPSPCTALFDFLNCCRIPVSCTLLS